MPKSLKANSKHLWGYKMKSLKEIQEILDKNKNELREKYGVKRIGVFGSYARGEQKTTSDIDIFIELEKPLGLRFVNLAYYLEELLGIRVELITSNAIKQKPRLLKSVMEDLIYV